VRALMEYLSTNPQFEAWTKMDHHNGFSTRKGASLDWYTRPEERAAAEIADAARKAGDLQFIAADAMWPTVHAKFYESISDYVAGKIDLDTALKQIDAARPALAQPTVPPATAPPAAQAMPSPQPTGSSAQPLADQWIGVWGSSSNDVFVAGYQGEPVIDNNPGKVGRIMHYDGSAWSPMSSAGY